MLTWFSCRLSSRHLSIVSLMYYEPGNMHALKRFDNFINFLSNLFCIIWHVATSLYCFYYLIWKNEYNEDFSGRWHQVGDMKSGFGLPSGCPFSFCQNMSLPLSFTRLQKLQNLLSSEHLAGQVSGNFR
jgi:hypothetical protein